jgi:hypothetical protein
VQKVREAAAMSKCRNNLKQLALACHNYHDNYQILPRNGAPNNPGTGNPGGAGCCGPGDARWSWLARILPYIEQQNIYNQAGVPTTAPAKSAAAQAVIAMPIQNFFCPSDIAQGMQARSGNPNTSPYLAQTTNYKGVMGSMWCYGAYPNKCPAGPNPVSDASMGIPGGNSMYWGLDKSDGIFSRADIHWPVRLATIADGTSNTLMIGEDVPELNEWNDWWSSNGAIGTCAIPLDNSEGAPGYGDWPNLYSFRSRHSRIVNFAAADGSVHGISVDIPLTLYRQLATIAGGETVSIP